MKVTASAETWINAICVWSIQGSQYGQILHHHVADKRISKIKKSLSQHFIHLHRIEMFL
jgi:hypothetical protein